MAGPLIGVICLWLHRRPPGLALQRLLGMGTILSIVIGAALSFSDNIVLKYTLTAPLLALNGLAMRWKPSAASCRAGC